MSGNGRVFSQRSRRSIEYGAPEGVWKFTDKGTIYLNGKAIASVPTREKYDILKMLASGKGGTYSLGSQELKFGPVLKEAVMTESSVDANKQVFQLLSRDYDVVSDDTRYPYGRYRGDVRQKIVYARKDGQPVPEADINLFKDRDETVRKEGGSMAALAGIYTSKLSDDGMQIIVDYYRHTAG